MTIVDTDPLVALQSRRDGHHVRCVEALAGLAAPLVTTWPGLTEATFLLRRDVGTAGVARIMRLVVEDALAVADLDRSDVVRKDDLMRRCADAPMKPSRLLPRGARGASRGALGVHSRQPLPYLPSQRSGRV